MSRRRSRVSSRGRSSGRSRPGRVSASALALALGCAPIDVDSTVTVHPREAPVRQFGPAEPLDRPVRAEYVQLGPRVLVSVREHPRCVEVRHLPVMRVEQIDRSNRNFVIWDFTLGIAAGGFAALAFARPQAFGDPLVDGQGRVVYDNTAGYTVGGIFAALAVGLLTAGVVNAIKSRDETRYAAAYELERGPAGPCPGVADAGSPIAGRALRLKVGELELDATTDEQGRARFELPASLDVTPADGTGTLAAVLVVGEGDAYLRVPLRAPFAGMVDAHTGAASSLAPDPDAEAGPRVIEGPTPAAEQGPNRAPAGFGVEPVGDDQERP